jgi:hypothetical protein
MLSNAVPKPKSRLLEKAERRASEAAEMRACYRQVDQREEYRCRVTSVSVNPSSPSMLERGHHHHLIYRSRGGGHHTNNVVLVSAKTHLAIHAGEIRLSGDADVVNGVLLERYGESGWMPERWI